jgi:hypothetical protein
MEDFNYSSKECYENLLEKLYNILNEINQIILFNLNEIFFEKNLEIFKNNILISDTISILKNVDFDLNKIGYSNNFYDLFEKNILEKSNSFYILSKSLDSIMEEISNISNNFYTKFEKIKDEKQKKLLEEKQKIKKPKKTFQERGKKVRVRNKKSYEVDILSDYIIELLNEHKIKNIIEMGCGKSYLTDNVLIKDDIIYFGIDKKDHLIENSNLKTKENIFLISEIVNYENFNEIYEDQIKNKLSENKNKNKSKIININNINISLDPKQEIENQNEIEYFIEKENNNQQYYNDNSNNNHYNFENIMLFGLHACGNLTSDSLKIFAKNKVLTHLVMVGCCFNLLMEFISKETMETKLYKDYINSIGYNNKGSFLENTLLTDSDFRKIGYPLSLHIREKYKDKFLGRSIRNVAMQNIPKENDYDINALTNFKYKSLLYRTMLQCFFEIYFPELKFIYGYDKLKLSINDSFSLYLKNFLLRFEEMIDNNDVFIKDIDNKFLKEKLNILIKRIKYIPEESNEDFIENGNLNSSVNDKINTEEFYDYYKNYESILWAFYTIRIKFVKIIEYIVVFDRIIYLFENGLKKIQLVKIFDENKSPRNLLIYASKNK